MQELSHRIESLTNELHQSQYADPRKLRGDIVIPPDIDGLVFLAEVSANDPAGVTVYGVKENDVIEIRSVEGTCAFDDRGNLGKFLSFAAILGGPVAGIVPFFSAGMPKLVADGLRSSHTTAKILKGNKRRDGYGKIADGKNFAAKEGGIIVCMPSAHGPRYYSDGKDGTWQNKSGAERDGRLAGHVNAQLQSICFFPCQSIGGTMKQKATEDGVIYILAFDGANDYTDNTGSYEVVFSITRSLDKETEVKEELAAVCDAAGLKATATGSA